MDREFWLKTVVTFLVAVGGAIIGAILKPVATAKVAYFFSARQLKKSRKQRETDLREYEQIKAFRAGTRDKQAYYVILGTVSVALFVGASMCLLAVLILYVTGYGRFEHFATGLIFGVVFSLLGILGIAVMSTTAARLEQFDEYEKSVKEKWPDAFS
jgi:hypothetical protein